VVEVSNHQSHELHAIEMGVYANIKTANDFLITGDHRLQGQFEGFHQQLRAAIATYESTYRDSSLLLLLSSMQKIKVLAHQVFTLPFATENMEGPILVEEIASVTKQAIEHLRIKHHALDSKVNDAMHMMEGLRLDMREETLALMLIILFLLSFLTYFIYSQVVMPLVQMKQAVRRVGHGKFDVYCDVKSEDEIGELGTAFNAMGATLEEREIKLNRARNLAAHQEKMNAMSVMSAGIAHEVGNPLASVAMLLELSKHKLKKKNYQAVAEHVQAALQETQRMESIIQSVLNFGRHDMDAQHHAFTLEPTLQHAIRLVKMSPSHKRIPIYLQIEENLPSVFASDGMLLQVLLNILYNACHACQGGGEVNVCALRQDKKIVIDICDTGSGIDQSVREDVFKPNFTTKAQGEGTGLGLAISKELVDSMRGSLELVNEHDVGTCFRICLPQYESKAGI